MSTIEQNARAIRRCVDLFNKRTSEWIDTCFAENADWIDLPIPGMTKSRQDNRAFLRESAEELLRLYPDRQMSICNLVALGEQVVLELDWRGTTAEAVGTLAAGTAVHFLVASFFTISDGMITRQTDYCIPMPAKTSSQ